MDRMEMVEKLREKANLTMEEAKELLEKHQWDMLDACVELEKTGKMKEGAKASTEEKDTSAYEEVSPTVTGKSYSGKKDKSDKTGHRIREGIRTLIRMGIDNKFVVKKADETLITVPVLIPLGCLVVQFWISAIVLLVGLVFGLKYSFEGKELGTESINQTVEKATDAANEFVNNLKDRRQEEKNLHEEDSADEHMSEEKCSEEE